MSGVLPTDPASLGGRQHPPHTHTHIPHTAFSAVPPRIRVRWHKGSPNAMAPDACACVRPHSLHSAQAGTDSPCTVLDCTDHCSGLRLSPGPDPAATVPSSIQRPLVPQKAHGSVAQWTPPARGPSTQRRARGAAHLHTRPTPTPSPHLLGSSRHWTESRVPLRVYKLLIWET